MNSPPAILINSTLVNASAEGEKITNRYCASIVIDLLLVETGPLQIVNLLLVCNLLSG
jgi:hypothetical protein